MDRILYGILLFGAGLSLDRVIAVEKPAPSVEAGASIEETARRPAAVRPAIGAPPGRDENPGSPFLEIPPEKMRSILDQIPSYLLRQEADERRFQSLAHVGNLFPRRFSNLQDERLLSRWFDRIDAGQAGAYRRGAFMSGDFRYDVDGVLIDGKVIMRLAPNSEGGAFACSDVYLVLHGKGDERYEFSGSCHNSGLILQDDKSSVLLDFDVEEGSSENLGRRVLIEVPYVSGGNTAILIDSQPSYRSFGVSWRSLAVREGERLQEEIARLTGVHHSFPRWEPAQGGDVSE